MRGTVRHLDADRVVIDTDAGLVRELPAAYVAEHVEHAYALTGHGMQGGTVETAIVVASPARPDRGLELHGALARARRDTPADLRRASSPRSAASSRPPSSVDSGAASDSLARVERRMLERDDEDLAIEQLPGAGRADDPELAGSRRARGEPPQERAAARAEPAPPAAASPTRLRELRERIEQLQAQLQALPTQRAAAHRGPRRPRAHALDPARAARRAARAPARADTPIRARAGPPRRRARPSDQRAASARSRA